MTLAVGTRLGPYLVQSPLGAGGMGEVYRATDTRLNRDVALKILPAAFAQDAERLARFQREAQVLASLNHPNIGGIHGLEDSDGLKALVLELIDGPTLADRIESGPLPAAEAIAVARQIADALAAAHEHGVVHRDLKPSNIKLRPDGTVKVLDFGLAKAVGAADGGSHVQLSMSPTLTSPAMATGIGVILGTAAYMSPEQAKGRPVDKRADVWAFGCVLYEMLTAARAFEGDDVSDTMAGILRGDPDWQRLPADTPRALVRLLKRCLQKDRAQRLQDIGDAKFDLQDALEPVDAVSAVPVAPPATSGVRRALPIAAATMLAATLAGSAAWFWRPAPVTPLVKRFEIVLPGGETFTSTGRTVIALSPQGTHLAYIANQRLFVRALDQLTATELQGTEGIGDMASRNPFFSPDGQSVGFWQGGQLKRIGIEGGSAVTIAQAPQPFGVSWHADGFIYYGTGQDGIWRVPGTGGTPERLIEARDGEILHGPQMMPDGDYLLFSSRPKTTSSWDQGQIVVQSPRTGERRTIVARGRDGRVLPTGHLIYADTGTIFAIRFDADRLAIEGGAAAIVQDVFDAGGATGTVQAAVSETGVLAFVRNASATQRGSMVRVDRSGREVATVTAAPVVGLSFPRVSPDGTHVAAVAGGDVWIYDIAGRPPIRVTFQNTTYSPVWSPDGKRLVYESGTPASLMSVPADGSGTTPVAASPPGHYHPHGMSSDGSEILAVALDSGTSGTDIVRLGPAPKFEPATVVATPNREGFEGASLSPDRRWLAYTSNATGQIEIWVQPYPGPGSPMRISPAGGSEPVWSRSGRELFYLQGRTLMAVSIGAQAELTFSPPTRLFELGQVIMSQPPSYDVLPDGTFVLIKTLDGAPAAPPIVMTLNWFEELKRRLP